MKFLNRHALFLALILLFIYSLSLLANVHADVHQDRPKSAQEQIPQKSQDQDIAIINMGKVVVVNVTVSVLDPHNRFVTGLEMQHFHIYNNGIEEKIEYFNTETLPVTMGIVFDISNSMEGEKIKRSQSALSHLINYSKAQDQLFLETFNKIITLQQDFTRNGDAIIAALGMTQTKGSTAFYDAVYASIEKIKQGEYKKKVLVVISDGQDNSSRYTLGELKNLIKETDILIYTVIVHDTSQPETQFDRNGEDIMEGIAAMTGGRSFKPLTDEELDSAYAQIGGDIRHQYVLGFSLEDSQCDGQWHKLKLKISPPKGNPKFSIRAKEGFMAPAKSRP